MSSSVISDSQKEFIISSIKNDFRIDGRTNSEPQKHIVKINNLQHLLGSCLLNIQSSPNEVHIYTGIKLKVQKQSPASNKLNTSQHKNIRQRISLQVGCIKRLTQQEEQARSYLEQYLNKYIVDNYLSQFQSLLSIPTAKRHYLTINIETYLLSAPHISYLEYLFLCAKTAIQNLQLPKFTVAFNQVTDEEVIEVSEEGRNLHHGHANQRKQNLAQSLSSYKGLHSIKIVGVLGQNYLQGMTLEEYQAVDSTLLVAFDQDNKVVSFESLKGTLKVQEIHQIIKFARA